MMEVANTWRSYLFVVASRVTASRMGAGQLGGGDADRGRPGLDPSPQCSLLTTVYLSLFFYICFVCA